MSNNMKHPVFNHLSPKRLLAFLVLFLFCFASMPSCKDERQKDDQNKKISGEQTVTDEDDEPEVELKPVQFSVLPGIWSLRYGGNNGYDFHFTKNYKSIIVIYIGNQILVFKGVYTIEADSKLRINVSEMKQDDGSGGVNLYGGFQKVKSSYIIFKANLADRSTGRTLVIRPLLVIIDGKNSDGYFEPVIKLKKAG